MVYNTETLLAMTESELADLFSKAEVGPIPSGAAEGTAIIAPGTSFTREIAKPINLFTWQAVCSSVVLPETSKRLSPRQDSVQRTAACEPGLST
ncbi:uncharacterized protein ALTATR162_LOCUS429 [Alternaria atra]|uniref:Uncharacterized protein n=1 Tax=Alternaria atra TaxID=119953 RepID=A0A8J2HRX0_9PLEO|nr:uncharacterized protein ALTATR162_LOCUS429 [Alternaria atra]CAG5138735.1 unnamed protein product [Alternaria atra]